MLFTRNKNYCETIKSRATFSLNMSQQQIDKLLNDSHNIEDVRHIFKLIVSFALIIIKMLLLTSLTLFQRL